MGDTNKKDIWFELNGTAEEIREEDEYGGIRFHVIGHLANIRIPFSIDIATGDPIYPLPRLERYSTILGDIIELNIYPLETVLSEKLQTILTRAENFLISKKLIFLSTNPNVAKFFSTNYPELKRLNRRGLYRMKQFYESKSDDEKSFENNAWI